MAYQAKRNKLFTEEFELVKESGETAYTLHVALDPDSVAKKLAEKHVALVNALKDVREIVPGADPEKSVEVLGNAVTDLIQAVFGGADADIIIDFYEGRYIEMCREVVPFITGTVIPSVRRISQENRKQIAAGYARNRKRK